MEQVEKEMAIDSLSNLESYYQSRYEYYLAMATEASEHRERVRLLLQDLLIVENYRVESSSIGSQPFIQSYEPERQFNGQIIDPGATIQISNEEGAPSQADKVTSSEPEPPEVVATNLKLSDSKKSPQNEAMNTQNEVEQIKRFLEEMNQALSVIESIVDSDSGKTLHTSYLHQRLNLELERELSVELVELYLEFAVTRGYLELDKFDRSCYLVRSTKELSADENRLPLALVETGIPRSSKDSPTLVSGNPTESVLQNEDKTIETVLNHKASAKNANGRKLYNLPPSSKLKPTLFETIKQYINKCSPKRFSIEDVVNYLYPQKQQLNWSQAKKNKVRTSISNVLGRKTYLGKHWSRIKPGVYRPQ